MRRFCVRLVRVAVALTTALVLAPAFAADATGTWLFDVTTPAGTGTPTVTLAQQGETLTGEYRGQLGNAPITRPSAGAPRKRWLPAFRPPAPGMNPMMMVGFPGICFFKWFVHARVRISPTPPGELPRMIVMVLP